MARKKCRAVRPQMRKQQHKSEADPSKQEMAGSVTQDVSNMLRTNNPQIKFTYRWGEPIRPKMARINSFCRLPMIPLLMDGLSTEDKNKFKTGVFGPIIKMSTRMKMSNQIIHFMLMHEVKTRREHSMWFGINQVLLRFGITEFAEITGLNCSDEYFDTYEENPEVDMKSVVGVDRCANITLEDIYMKEPKESPYKYKMALILFIDAVIVAKDRKTQINQQTINMVADLDRLNAFPWGRLAYIQTKKFLQSCDAGRERNSGGYNIGGFPLSLQIFAFHSMTKLSKVFATLIDEDAMPLCHRWVSKSGQGGKPFPGYAEIKAIVQNINKNDIKTVQGSHENDDSDQWNNETDDERLDLLFDVGFENVDIIITRPNVAVEEEKPFSMPSPSITIRNIVKAVNDDDDFVDPPKKQNLPVENETEDQKKKGKRKAEASTPTVIPPRSSKRINKAKETEAEDAIRRSPEQSVEVTKKERPDGDNKETHSKVHVKTRSSKRTNKTKEAEATEEINRSNETSVEEIKSERPAGDSKATQSKGHENTRLNTSTPEWVAQIMDKLNSIQKEQHELAEKIEHQAMLIEDLTTYSRDLGTLYDKLDTTVYISSKRTETKIKNLVKEMAKSSSAANSNAQTEKNDDTSSKVKLDDAMVQDLAGGSSELKQDVNVADPVRRVGLRVQKDSKYKRTPFRKNVKLPKEPTMSMLHNNERQKLYNWVKNKDDKGLIRGFIKNISREAVLEILKPGGWIKDEAIDEILMHMRKSIVDTPERFAHIAVLSSVWTRSYNSATYASFVASKRDTPNFKPIMFDVISGDSPQMFRKPLYDVDVIYSPFNLRDSHWVALEIDLTRWCIYVYDPQINYIKEEKLKELLEPLAIMFPKLLTVHGRHTKLGDKLKTPLNVIRKTGLNVNEDGGSCGIYTLRYIQHLASGRTDLSAINDDTVQASREKLANVVYTRDWSTWFDDN